MRFPILAVLVLGLALASTLPSAPARADEGAESDAPLLDQVTLRNGSIFEGRIVSEDEEAIVLDLASETGRGRMRLPRSVVSRVVRGAERGVGGSPASVRDAWFLLKSGGRTVGTRRLSLRYRKGETGTGWLLEEDLVQFPRGPHVPASRIHRMETTDLAFHPQLLHHREVDEASIDPNGPPRYERVLTGPVRDGVWTALVREGATGQKRPIPVPEGLRGRLGTREDLLRRREVGLHAVRFMDAATGAPETVRAGYTALGVRDENGALYDEFVWEEDGVRRVSRFRDAEVLEEWVTEGVVAVPVTQAQAEAARAEADRQVREGEADVVRLPEAGLALRLPGDTWTYTRVEVPPGTRGWRHVGRIESRYFVADVRIEWDPEAVTGAPGADEAEARLLQRLRTVCPDLAVHAGRTPLGERVPDAWRMELSGTLKGERVRTVVVVVTRGSGRALLLVACPESTWSQAAPSIERMLDSIEVL